MARFRCQRHLALRQQRKVALRLGQLPDHVDRELKPEVLNRLRRGELQWGALVDENFQLNIKQKAVGMKAGLDVASLAYKKPVDRVVLIAGDADFVPAARLARREGVDFILNPMERSVSRDPFEHIDGLHSVRLKPIAEKVAAEQSSTPPTTDA